MKFANDKAITPLVIPFKVMAMYCPSPRTIAKPNADFSKISYFDKQKERVINPNMPYISENLVSQPFDEAQKMYLDKGLHLHFILPSFLRSSIPVGTSDDFEYDFPAIPNRWLVFKNTGKDRAKSFLIESDYLYPEYHEAEDKLNIPIPKAQWEKKGLNVPFRYMGRQIELNAEKETKPEYWFDIMEKPLTAEGYGDLAFTGSFPNCKGVLTFYDPDVEDGDTYDILGYYDLSSDTQTAEGDKDDKNGYYDLSDDTQTTIQKYLEFFRSNESKSEAAAEKLQKVKEELQKYWNVTFEKGANLDIKKVNDLLLMSRLKIEDKKNFVPKKDSKSFKVAIGNSGTEAIAAYFEKSLKIEGLENKLEAIQFESLRNGTVDLGAKFGEARHRNSFIPQEGGICYTLDFTVTPNDSKDAESNRPIREIMEQPELKASLNKAKKELLQLNKIQEQYDKATFQLRHKRQQLFADWYKYMLCAHPPYLKDAEYPRADDVLRFILRNINDSIAPQLTQNGFLSVDAETAQPSLLEIQDSKINKQNKDSTAGKIVSSFEACTKTLNELNQKIKEALTKKLKELDKQLKELEKVQAKIEKKETPELKVEQHRIEESLKNLKPFIVLQEKEINYHLTSEPAERYFKPAEPVVMIAQNDKKEDAFEDDDLHAVWMSGVKAKDIISGDLFDNAECRVLIDKTTEVNGAEYASQSLLMDWLLDYRPILDPSLQADGYDRNFIFSTYDLREDTPDFAPLTTRNIDLSDVARTYRGRTILSTGSPEVLKAKLTAFQKEQEAEDTDLAKVIKALEAQEIVTQSLGGLNEALLMRKETMQLEVTDPIAFETYKPVLKNIADWIGDERISAPEPAHFFNPIRAGVMVINKLRIIDTFGIETDIYNIEDDKKREIHKCATLQLPDKTKIPARFQHQKEQMLYMSPRFSQAAKLNMKWLGANELVGNDAQGEEYDANPVCGWMMPNLLENTLQIFNQSGELLGAIGVEDAQVVLLPSPGASKFQISDVYNEHLRNFVGYFYRPEASANTEEKVLDVEVFTSFLLEIEQALDFVEPETFRQNRQLSVLAGRPLAIVRTSLNLEVKGDYAINQDWNIFKRDLYQDVRTHQRSTYHFENVEIPLRIGDFHQMNDGVIGFWYRNIQKGVEESSADLSDYDSFNPHTINKADTFYMPLNDRRIGKRKKSAANASDDQSFLIGQRLNETPQVITMLFDPRGMLNVSAGLLPVKSKKIPAEYYQKALERMRIHFQLAPVITPYDSLQLSLPKLLDKEWVWLEIDKIGAKVEIPAAPTISKPIFDKVYFKRVEQLHKDLWKVLNENGWLIKIEPAEGDTQNEEKTQKAPAQFKLAEGLEDKSLPHPYTLFQNEITGFFSANEQKTSDQVSLETAYHKLMEEKCKTVWEHLLISKRINKLDATHAYINFNPKEHQPLPNYIDPKMINDIFNAHQDGIFEPITEPQYEQMAIREGWVKFA